MQVRCRLYRPCPGRLPESRLAEEKTMKGDVEGIKQDHSKRGRGDGPFRRVLFIALLAAILPLLISLRSWC